MKKLCGGAGFIACICTLLGVHALPAGEYVESGGARFKEVGQSRLDITCQDLTVINWDTFSIDAHEHLIFHLKEGERVLNQVDGHFSGLQMSRILGTLESKGDIFLVNPAGILIGKDAFIDVGSLVASTLQIKSSEFLALKDLKDGGAFELSLSGGSASKIVNLGKVHASIGSIMLFAPEIENYGALEAPTGNVGLYSTYTALIELKKKSHPLIRAKIDCCAEPRQHSRGITQEGAIEALKVEMESASHAYALAINQAGHIEAKSISSEGGKIYLRAHSGRISHAGSISAAGGEVTLSAPEISLECGSEIDVSSKFKAGRILLGSKGTQALSLHKGAELYADGLISASGGEIKCFSEGSFEMEALARVQGGFHSGHGGNFLVQTPKDGFFEFNGSIDAKAPRGWEGAIALIGPFGKRQYLRACGSLEFDSSGSITLSRYPRLVRALNPFFKEKKALCSKELTLKVQKAPLKPKVNKVEPKSHRPQLDVKSRPLSVDVASGLMSSKELGSSHHSSFTKQRVEGMFSRPKSIKAKKAPKTKGRVAHSHRGKKSKKSQKQKKIKKASKAKKNPRYPGQPT